IWLRLFFLLAFGAFAIIAKGRIPFPDRRTESFGLRLSDKIQTFLRVAGYAIEKRSYESCGANSLVFCLLIEKKFHELELIAGHKSNSLGQLHGTLLKLAVGHDFEDQAE